MVNSLMEKYSLGLNVTDTVRLLRPRLSTEAWMFKGAKTNLCYILHLLLTISRPMTLEHLPSTMRVTICKPWPSELLAVQLYCPASSISTGYTISFVPFVIIVPLLCHHVTSGDGLLVKATKYLSLLFLRNGKIYINSAIEKVSLK